MPRGCENHDLDADLIGVTEEEKSGWGKWVVENAAVEPEKWNDRAHPGADPGKAPRFAGAPQERPPCASRLLPGFEKAAASQPADAELGPA